MSWILLTNDDGIESPAVAPFATALRRLGDVRVCVPDRERSWIGKAISRHGPIEVAEVAGRDVPTWTTTGTPADTVQVAIHTIWDEPPALVVSGINIGINAGAGFLLSSGTVGAAFEGWVSGLPAIAFSTGSPVMDWPDWRRHVLSRDGKAGWERMADLCTDLLADLLETDLATVADVVSVNLPWEADVDTPRRLTDVGRVGYGALFDVHTDDDNLRHFGWGGDVHDRERNGEGFPDDVDVFVAGEVSITPLRAPGATIVSDDLQSRIERR